MRVRENVDCAGLTTLGIGGAARYLCEITAEEEIAEVWAWGQGRGLPWMALGGGSNLLVSDQGYAGLLLCLGLRGMQELGGGRVVAAAGENWDAFVAWSVARGLAGCECMSGIPGTVGATPVQNVGAYGQEVAEIIECVRAWDSQTQDFVEFAAAECGFAYRSSRFNQHDAGRFLITAVTFGLRPGGGPALRYPGLQKRQPGTLAETRAAVLDIRRGKAMLLAEGEAESRSAGSFFKNPVVETQRLEVMARAAGSPPPSFAAGEDRVKVPAAWLIEQAGFHRGYRTQGGRVGLSSRHVLAIVNYGGASARDVVELARTIRAGVQERFALRLEPEPVQVGFAAGEGL